MMIGARKEPAFAVALGASLTVFGVLTLVVHAFVSLVSRVSTFKRYTAKQMLIALLVMFSSAFSAGARVIVRTVAGILRWWLIYTVVFTFFSFMYVTFTEYPTVWLGAVRFYNGNVGPLVHELVIIPLQVTDILLRGILPLWDAVWWFLKTLAAQGLLPILVEEAKTVMQMATALLHLMEHVSNSLLAFMDAFFCDGGACLHPEKGILDLLSPMGDVREVAALGVKLLRQFCSTLSVPVDLLAFPLLDLNLAEGVHNLGNAVVQLLVVIPHATVARCGLAHGNQFDTLMCTPDLAPFFNFLVAGMSSLGQAVDNWGNVAFLIVESAITGARGGQQARCDSASDMMMPDLVANGGQGFFAAGAYTVVVGLTDWLYAVTDGVTAVYMGHNDPGQAKTQPWPYPGMDMSMGVAAVTYSSVHELDVSAFSSGKTAGSMQTTAMLACNCTDDTLLGMRILCSILPMAGVPQMAALEDYLVQVLFPDAVAASLYVCRGVDIYVKSVRWSFTRYSSQDASLGSGGERTTLPTTDCIARGTCRELDATVWVVPRCGQEENQNDEKACLEDAPCYPFCMAARSAGGGRDNLMLARAGRWREGLVILGQDCAMATSSPVLVGSSMGDSNRHTVSWTGISNTGAVPPGKIGVGMFASSYKPPECTRSPRVTSVVYHAPTGSRAAAANVRTAGQPFAITGDTTLMEVGGSSSAGGWRAVEQMAGSVQVERLMGDEVDAFTLHPMAQTLPSLPRVLVPMSEAERTDTTKVTVPYSYGTTRIAATNSRNYVFYASNPNLDVFSAYFDYCSRKDNESLAKAGLLSRSSFAPMRVYRIEAYRRCATYSCGANLARFITIDGFDDEKFDKNCAGSFNVSVVGLEYLNEDNIAVTIQSSRPNQYNPATLRWIATQNTTYWLNPATMGLRRSIWQTAVPSSNYAALCPSLQRLPRMGSFAAEVVNSGVFLLKTVITGVVYTPGMVLVWRGGGKCPPVGGAANYHSVLGGCGSGLYSLDDFFDSVDDAGAIFWHSLSLLGKLVASSRPVKRLAEPLTRVMDGTAQYGGAMIDIWSARASILTLTRVPVKEQVDQLWASVQPAEEGGTRQQGLSYGSSALSGWSRFSYKTVSTVALGIVKRALDPAALPLTAAWVFQQIWADLYDLKDEFDATITRKNRMGCAGLKLIFGADNPWASLLYHQCVASAELSSDLMMGLGLNMFVLIPMAKCVCKDSRGKDVASYVRDTCAPSLPVSLIPTLYTIANEARAFQLDPDYRELQCELVLKHVRGEISRSLDSWFENQHQALEALGSSVDYATATFDSNAGRCMDFSNDPHTVVIVPQPVDYFQRCSGTSLCKQRCALEWARFQDALEASRAKGPSETATVVSVETESMFFPGDVDGNLVLNNAAAVVEVPASRSSQEDGVCLARPRTTPPDYVLAVAELAGAAVRVRYWCAPLMTGSGVYLSESTSGYGPTSLPGIVMSVSFGDDTGEWVAALVEMDGGKQRVFLVNATGQFITPPFEDRMGPKQVLMRVENMWSVAGGILVDLVTRRMEATGSEATGMGLNSLSETIHVFLTPPLGGVSTNTSVSGVWHGSSVDLMQFGGGQYWYTRQGHSGSHYLFLPKTGRAMGIYRVSLRVVSGGKKVLWLQQVEPPVELGNGWGADLSNLGQSAMLASVSQTSEYVFSVSAEGWNWLRQTRIDPDGFVSGVYGSARVTTEATIQGNCNELSCEGCTSLAVQRLCLAFNQCALINCVGTPVHQLRPLCGIGGLLKHWGEMSLKSTHGAWTIFTEMLGLTLELNMLSVKEAHLLWPENSFLCYVCQAKDASAEFFSILTATVNSALQIGEANIAYMYGGASNVDTNADAALTISSTALNGFMHQVALLPLYLMIASRQVMMCQVTGVLALLDTDGFKLSLQASETSSASDIIAGQCLTVGAEVLAKNPGDSKQSVAATVGSIASNAVQLLLIQQIEPFLHFMDAALAYVIGVVHTLGVLVMSQNMAICNPPQFNLADILKCACDDHRLQIPAAQRTAGLEQGAMWCTGVLSMVDGNSKPFFVYNKFTYSELQAMSAGLDEYARCVGTGTSGFKCAMSTPRQEDADFFTQQGVTVANVLVKCRDNFAKKQWDPYAFAFYNRAYHYLFSSKTGARIAFPNSDPFGIRECLQRDPANTPSLSQVCFLEFLRHPLVKMREEDYWAYERVDEGKTASQFTDACLVFSGPADLKRPLFTDCVDGGGDSTGQCRLAGHAWTPLSENQVPVAGQHRVLSYGQHAEGLVQRLYEEARSKVVSAVEASKQLQGENSDHVDVEFFSVEGDILHQTMDCMFMGPYSRVDYWPIPSCTPGEGGECLVGPYWARDEAGGGGRGVDPDACPTLPTLPYTCGSPARKALMRYLVKNMLSSRGGRNSQNGSVIHETMMRTLDEITQDWNNTGMYGCPCGPGNHSAPFDPACCRSWGGPLLQPHMEKSYMPIDSAKVMQAMEDDLGKMYAMAMEDTEPWLRHLRTVAPDEPAQYARWNESVRVQDEARFNPTRPVGEYTSAAESLVPLADFDSTLWDVCHAALKQTFFTLPVQPDGSSVVFDPELSAFDGDPLKLQAYVKNFTRAAWRHSPLFRYYSPRHMPSESQMCSHTPSPGSPASADNAGGVGRLSFTSFMQRRSVLLPGSDLPGDIPVFSAQRFRVGAEDVCMCGWPLVPATRRCKLPTTGRTHELVCAAVPAGVCDSEYTYDLRVEETSVLPRFSSDWYCPEYEVSPHWGMTDANTAEEWLAGGGQNLLATSSRDLLKHGRSGLRVGNVWPMAVEGQSKKSINPRTRKVPLERGKLTTCSPPPAMTTENILDELFPAAQAVEENGAVAYCLRYVIEVARLEILLLTGAAAVEGEAVTQRERVSLWHRRCGAQLHLLHLCKNLGIYRPRLLQTGASACPHFILPTSHLLVRMGRAYATKECMVSVDGRFYDPCRCVFCAGNKLSELDLDFVINTDLCKIRFEIGDILNDASVPIGWIEGVHPLLLQDPLSGAVETPALLREDFATKVVDDPDAAGNTATSEEPWWQAEGLMSENSQFCDGVLDWWPDEWDYPVGYHVTVPCDAGETAYRSFAQAFALDEEAGALVYQHDLLRDAGLADSHFGVGALCRRGNFGMPLYETNNMRYCTSLPAGEGTEEDFTLARVRSTAAVNTWAPMKCTPSSRDLPWPDSTQPTVEGGDRYDSSLYSVGTVPNMPDETAEHYPSKEEDMVDVGPWQEVVGVKRWGATSNSLCQDFKLALCQTDLGCPSGYACRGRVCSGDRARKCTAPSDCAQDQTCDGVCMERDTVDCISHSDCAASMMCSGVGKCVQPTLVVHNRLEEGDNISLGLLVADSGAVSSAGGNCGSGAREYSLTGASYWGNTGQDLLRVHGMCSFQDWFKYAAYYGNTGNGGCASTQADGTLRVDPSQCLIMNLNRQMQNQSRWWPPGAARPELMYLRPTNCDRDYERLKNYAQCAPNPGVASLLYPDNTVSKASVYDRFVQLHSAPTSAGGSPRLLLADMPERNNTDFGVLGLSGAIKRSDDLLSPKGEHNFIPCTRVAQCFAPPFSVNGVVANRTFLDPTKSFRRTRYPDTTVFKCGVFGLEAAGGLGCRLDLEVLPLYRALCLANSGDASGGIKECKAVVQGGGALCENIRLEYQPTNLERTANLRYLKDLFYAFPAFDTLEGYLDLTQCMAELHARISSQARQSPGEVSNGLYYPLMFVLKEMPFDWFYQCVVMGGTRINEASWLPQDCRAYKERALHKPQQYTSISSEGDSLQTYLRYVRGGYTWDMYKQFQDEGGRRVTDAVRAARKKVQGVMYPPDGTDGSYPVCSKNLLWKIGSYGAAYSELTDPYNPDLRAIIHNWMDPQECRSVWHEGLLNDLPASLGITESTWVRMLSYPDPEQVEPQSNPARTVMDEIEAYMMENTGVVESTEIASNSRGGIYYSTEVPGGYDEVAHPISDDLIPSVSYDQGTYYVDNGGRLVKRVCVFLPESDPLFSGETEVQCVAVLDMQGRTDPLLKQCRSKENSELRVCTSVPVWAMVEGKYNCRYQASGNVIPPGCNQENGGSCYIQVVRAMYAAVLREYMEGGNMSAIPRVLEAVSMPWFETGNAFWDGLTTGFSLATELDYERDIQPNPELSVMCDITQTDPSKRIKYTECNSPHYKALKAHATTHYKRDGGIIVPAGTQLEWPVDRGVLARGVILSYTNVNRQLNQTYMDALFNDDTVCKGLVTGTQRVCWNKAPLEFASINPWLLGNFNPFEACDVEFTSTSEGSKEYVYAQCLKEEDGAVGPKPCTRYLESPVPLRCKDLNRKLVSYPGVPRSVAGESLDYNLCYHKLDEDPDGCMHDQGLLGGFDGSPVASPSETLVTMLSDTKYEGVEKYVVGNSLYEPSEWSIPDDFRQGFYANGRNPLWHNESAPYGHLQINEGDIGGHRIGLVVSRPSADDGTRATRISVMAVERLPLGGPQSDSGFLNGAEQRKSRPTSEWVPELQNAMEAEDAEVSSQHLPMQSTDTLGPSCPLQRWMYYAGGYRAFSPAIPSALRAQHLFHRIHQGKRSHPTMIRASRGEFLGKYRTANGFCACPVMQDIQQPQCLIPSDTDSSRQCSLAQTIRSLRGMDGDTFQSHVFPPLDHMRSTRRCAMQLDWPNVNGTLRDGSVHAGDWTKASSPTHQECHVLDRFLPFLYQYKMSTEPLQAEASTTIEAGACQTARVVTLNRGVATNGRGRCLRMSQLDPTATSVRFTCEEPIPQGSPMVMQRRSKLTRQQMLERMKRQGRQKCSQCSAPPRFETTGGIPIPAESSFGRLYRHSVERMLAKDLQDALGSGTAEALLNESAWLPGRFMRNYMHTPHYLFSNLSPESTNTKPPVAPLQTQNADKESLLWTQGAPWVYCPTTRALKTGQGCMGSMTREDWIRSKATLCPQLVRSYSTGVAGQADPMARTPFCNLDSSTDRVCKAVAEAKALVTQANCIARGDNDCMPSPYVYHPASYEPSNNAWVHDSIQAFYLKIDPASCPVATGSNADAKTQELLDFTRKYQMMCPANALTLVKQILAMVRVIVTDVALLVSSMMSMAVKLLALLVTGRTDQIRNSVMDDWAYIKSKGAGMLSSLSDLMMDAMLNSGAMGLKIKMFLEGTCDKINSALRWFLNVW